MYVADFSVPTTIKGGRFVFFSWIPALSYASASQITKSQADIVLRERR
ncbi:MAG: hypothetical protein LBF12_02995 [Christensenellaceae bacterium]|nr:hypothetical protein [Christensenellaceae bacterium]